MVGFYATQSAFGASATGPTAVLVLAETHLAVSSRNRRVHTYELVRGECSQYYRRNSSPGPVRTLCHSLVLACRSGLIPSAIEW